jgi:hypothetical protein
MTQAVALRLHPDLEELLRLRSQPPRAPGFANAGVMVGLLPGCTALHLRDMAQALLRRAEQMER